MRNTLSRIILLVAILSAGEAAFAQGLIQNTINRFTDPEKGRTVFIEKGYRSIGISGGYRSFNAGGEGIGEGYSILSLLNIGDGSLSMYNVAPSFAFFVANDLSLGVRLDYEGYKLNTDLRANLGEIIDFSGLIDLIDEEDQEMRDEVADVLNMRISSRHMVKNSWGASLALRKYLSFFGSKTFGVFGEARLFGKYGRIKSCPIEATGELVENRMRTSDIFSTGLKFGIGVCFRLRDNSAFTINFPLLGASYNYTQQHKETKTGPSDAHLSQFNVSRDIDLMAIQIGYKHYIKSKK